jgi:hypothetical protein
VTNRQPGYGDLKEVIQKLRIARFAPGIIANFKGVIVAGKKSSGIKTCVDMFSLRLDRLRQVKQIDGCGRDGFVTCDM